MWRDGLHYHARKGYPVQHAPVTLYIVATQVDYRDGGLILNALSRCFIPVASPTDF